MAPRSTTVTDRPARAISRAMVRPATPPPRTTIICRRHELVRISSPPLEVCSPGQPGLAAPQWRIRDHLFQEALLHGARDPGVPVRRHELRPESAAGPAHGGRLQPVHLAVDRADDVLGTHHRLRGPARPEHQVLRADGEQRRLEDRGRRHLVRADLREGRHAEHGLAGHRAVRSEHPLSRHGRADARAVEHARQRRLEVDRRRQDVGESRPREELLHQQGRDRLEEPRHRLRGGRREALRQRDGLRAGALQDHRRRQDVDQPRPDEGPRRRRRRHRPAQLGHRHHGVLQARSEGLDVHRQAAGQRALQEHRRRQDLEEAGRGTAAGRGARADGPRDLREEPEHRVRAGRRGSEPRLPGARRRGELRGAGRLRRPGRRRGVPARLVVRAVQDVQDGPAVREAVGREAHADHGRRPGGSGHEDSTRRSATRTS